MVQLEAWPIFMNLPTLLLYTDIKSTNILLDEHLNAKVSDFGLSKPMGDDGKGHISTQVKGTMVSGKSF